MSTALASRDREGRPPHAEPPCDEDCLAAVQAGDTAAFGILYARYRHRLLSRARFKWQLPGDAAEDLAHDAWVRAMEHIGRFDRTRPLEPWLFRILDNAVIDHLRTSRTNDGRPRHVVVDVSDLVEVGSSDSTRAEDRLADREALTSALAALPARQQQTALGVLVSGLTLDEAAARLHLSNPACRQLLHRARASLRRTLLEQGALPSLLPPLPWLRRAWFAACRRLGGPETSIATSTGAAMTIAVTVTVGVAALATVAAHAAPVPAVHDVGQAEPAGIRWPEMAAQSGPTAGDARAAAAQGRRPATAAGRSPAAPEQDQPALVPLPGPEIPVAGRPVHQDAPADPDYVYGLEVKDVAGTDVDVKVEAKRREITQPVHEAGCDVAEAAPVMTCERSP